ncbi:PH domain-containing protein [Catelliglobosispora koreensis]|uniref:PH domain-containing protein n=1 Tax=Catelliglobosispora koreensis TaxID=129052 RepID=UPI000361843E|nr:PH domain-containing protein [Catelliglobosispora koreensis]
MAFPDDIMTADEKVVLHLRPHWKVMIIPTLVLVVSVAVFLTALLLGWAQAVVYIIAAVAVVLLLWLAFAPWLRWRTTHYIFTNERIIFQFGVFSRDRRDIPLMRVNDHAMSQNFIDRILGCGTLTIESAGERGQTVLTDIPRVGMVQTKLYELVEHDRDIHSFGDDERRRVVPVQAPETEPTKEEKQS